jgi:DNA modification methylase
MIFHDFPWGHGIAEWDHRLTVEEFRLRISAVNRLNSFRDTISFALCSHWDVDRIKEAYEAVGWTGGSLHLTVVKLNKMEPTKTGYGLINVTNTAVVTFRRGQGNAYWNFPTEPADQRHNVWHLFAEKAKVKDQDGVVNPSQQPIEIDQKAIQHWSQHGSWVFVDGFGSGTTLIAALRSGRSAVGTEPDHRQFVAARSRMQEMCAQLERESEQDFKLKQKESKATEVAARKELGTITLEQ